jgi:hypothetical protein
MFMLHSEPTKNAPGSQIEPEEFNENETLLEPHHDSEAVHRVFMLCTFVGTVLGTLFTFMWLGEQPVFYSQTTLLMLYFGGFSLGGALGYLLGTVVDLVLLGRFEG